MSVGNDSYDALERAGIVSARTAHAALPVLLSNMEPDRWGIVSVSDSTECHRGWGAVPPAPTLYAERTITIVLQELKGPADE